MNPAGAVRGVVTGLLALTLATPGRAWGPHTEITRAALEVLPGRDRLQAYLGGEWERLARDYVWTPDWQEAVRPDYYAEDHLLFPAWPTHRSHMHPVVRQHYTPFFHRAVQALRTEDATNAARWIGSLLHFLQDAGSPPHTTGTGGPLHGKMERWVDETRIHLNGYRPRLLGETDQQALQGLLARMDGLYAFSRARAVKLRPLLDKLDRRAHQPLELECALECARVSADVLHTLFTLGLGPVRAEGATLQGRLDYTPPRGYAAVPARVLLAGTRYSTTTGPDGRYRFRNLPAGRYTVWYLATGRQTVRREGVELKAGQTTTLAPRLPDDPVRGNLVRNPDFRADWLVPGKPDCWSRDPAHSRRWASAVLRIPVKRSCRIQIAFQPGQSPEVALRWRSNPASLEGSRTVAIPGGSGEAVVAAAPPGLVPFEKGVLYLEVLITAAGLPGEVVRHVGVQLTS